MPLAPSPVQALPPSLTPGSTSTRRTANACRTPSRKSSPPTVQEHPSTVLSLQTLLADLDAREAAIAEALEHLNQSAAVQAAYHQATLNERDRVLALIDLQLEHLGTAGINAISLRTLRRHILTDA